MKQVELKELNDDGWYSSKQTQKVLKIRSCELMHRRLNGALKFKKRGNAYFYKIKANNADK